jgi:putative transposase
MSRKKQETNRVDELLDDLLSDYQSPEEILGESGLLKQLAQRLIERALVGELSHHLRAEGTEAEEVTPASSSPRNSRNGYSKKTLQTQHGAMELSIPRDRNGDFEPVLVPKYQRRLAALV